MSLTSFEARLQECRASFVPLVTRCLSKDMQPCWELETFSVLERFEEIAYRLALCARENVSFMSECAGYLMYFASILDEKQGDQVRSWFDTMVELCSGEFPHSKEYTQVSTLCNDTQLSCEDRVSRLAEVGNAHAAYEAGKFCEIELGSLDEANRFYKMAEQKGHNGARAKSDVIGSHNNQ
eukprot:GILJ01014662.1.p1 GENE.GILJ01014662.1~~GILJ01014662.1.p1  ORF type:complete len:181 (-),score=11.06 GILJ01014662.1:764-1306(-)